MHGKRHFYAELKTVQSFPQMFIKLLAFTLFCQRCSKKNEKQFRKFKESTSHDNKNSQRDCEHVFIEKCGCTQKNHKEKLYK